VDKTNPPEDSREEKQENTTVPANTAKPPGPLAGHPSVSHPGNDGKSALLSHTRFTAQIFPAHVLLSKSQNSREPGEEWTLEGDGSLPTASGLRRPH